MLNFPRFTATVSHIKAASVALVLSAGLMFSCSPPPAMAGDIPATENPVGVKYDDLGGAPLRIIYACTNRDQFFSAMQKLRSGVKNGSGVFFKHGTCKLMGGRAASYAKAQRDGQIMFTTTDYEDNPVVAYVFPRDDGGRLYFAFWFSKDLLGDPV